IETLVPVVTITASDASAAETVAPATANPGRFTVTRTGDTTSDLVVNYTVTGTATNGTDYAALTGTVTIMAGSSSAFIDVTVINDVRTEGDETVIVMLSPAATYSVADPTSATVTIADNEPEVSITANDPNAAETVSPASPNPGQFTVTRTGDTTADLVVNYTVSGTATNGVDYATLSRTVTTSPPHTRALLDLTLTTHP